MSVHVLLTQEALEEAKRDIMASKNIVNISNGQVLATPAKDMLLGFYLMTDMNEVKNPRMFGSVNLAVKAYERDLLSIDEQILVKIEDEVVKTSVGRCIFNRALPEGYRFVNERVSGNTISDIIEDIKDNYT